MNSLCSHNCAGCENAHVKILKRESTNPLEASEVVIIRCLFRDSVDADDFESWLKYQIKLIEQELDEKLLKRSNCDEHLGKLLDRRIDILINKHEILRKVLKEYEKQGHKH